MVPVMASSAKRFRESARSGASELTPDEISALCRKLQSVPAKGRIVEIGTAAGGTLAEMCRTLGEDQLSRFLIVDTFAYFPDHRKIWEANLKRLGIQADSLEVFEGRSSSLRSRFSARGESCAFILIDAGHKLKDVIRDSLWLRFLDVEGIAAFHDYTPKFPGVCRAVDVFLSRNPEFEIDGREGALIFIRKTRRVSKVLVPGWLVAWLTIESLLGQWKRSLLKRLPGRRA